MNWAAFVFGILAGLAGLSAAATGHMSIELSGSNKGTFFYLLSLASFAGGIASFRIPVLGATAMTVSGIGWCALGQSMGYELYPITINAITLNGVGAVVAFFITIKEDGSLSGKADKAQSTVNSENVIVLAREKVGHRTKERKSYDQQRWNDILGADDDVWRVYEKLAPHGSQWTDKFATVYLAINDKSYLPMIIRKISDDLRQEAASRLPTPDQT